MTERDEDRSPGGVMNVIRENPYATALIAIGATWLVVNRARSRRVDHGPNDEGRDIDYREYQERYRAYGQSLVGTSHKPRESFEDARSLGSETLGAVRRTGRRAQGQLQRMLTDNPLLVGAAALALGAAFGLALPETERERDLMGEARDAVIDRAHQIAGDAVDRIQERASGIADAAGHVSDSLRRS